MAFSPRARFTFPKEYEYCGSVFDGFVPQKPFLTNKACINPDKLRPLFSSHRYKFRVGHGPQFKAESKPQRRHEYPMKYAGCSRQERDKTTRQEGFYTVDVVFQPWKHRRDTRLGRKKLASSPELDWRRNGRPSPNVRNAFFFKTEMES